MNVCFTLSECKYATIKGEDGDGVPNAGGQDTMQNKITLLQAGTGDEINIGLAKLANIRGGRGSDFPRNKEDKETLTPKFKNTVKTDSTKQNKP